jgi:hypothetical protein
MDRSDDHSGCLPGAKSSRLPEEREKLKRKIAQRGLGGLANDAKWDEFITAMRSRRGWRPSFRWKCIDGAPSRWDAEWCYHLPFPMLSVEWLDIACLQEQRTSRPSRISVIDHSAWIEPLLLRIGLDYAKGQTMFRIFGYAPRSRDLFDQ